MKVLVVIVGWVSMMAGGESRVLAESSDFATPEEQVRVLETLEKQGLFPIWNGKDPRTLEQLTLVGKKFDDASLAMLGTKQFPQACSIGGGNTSMTSKGFGRLWAQFPNASAFGCGDTDLDADDFAAPRPGQLRSLTLSRGKLDRRLLEKMLPFQRFDTLHFCDTDFCDDDFLLVNQHQWLETLSLTNCKITSKCLPAIGRCTKLTGLALSKADIDDKSMLLLGELENLEGLTLDDTPIGDDGLGVLLKLRRLRDLRLDGTRVTDAGIAILAQVPTLYSVDLSRTEVTMAGLKQLQEHPRLTEVRFDKTAITREEYSEFYHGLPAIRKKLSPRP